jgi:hypothetical protein
MLADGTLAQTYSRSSRGFNQESTASKGWDDVYMLM